MKDKMEIIVFASGLWIKHMGMGAESTIYRISVFLKGNWVNANGITHKKQENSMNRCWVSFFLWAQGYVRVFINKYIKYYLII